MGQSEKGRCDNLSGNRNKICSHLTNWNRWSPSHGEDVGSSPAGSTRQERGNVRFVSGRCGIVWFRKHQTTVGSTPWCMVHTLLASSKRWIRGDVITGSRLGWKPSVPQGIAGSSPARRAMKCCGGIGRRYQQYR